MKITILNMSDDSNKGDLGIMESTLGLIRKFQPDAQIAVVNADYTEQTIEEKSAFKHIKKLGIIHYGSFFPGVFSLNSGLKSFLAGIWNLIRSFWLILATLVFRKSAAVVLPRSFHGAFNAIRSADFVLLKGGSYIYSYGGIKQFLFQYRMLLGPLIAIILGKRMIALGHSIGPISGRLSKSLIKFCLNQCQLIIVREEISYRCVIETLGINPRKVELLPDLAFWFDPAGPSAQKAGIHTLLEAEGIPPLALDKPAIGITIRDWHFPLQNDPANRLDNYLNCLVELIDRAHEELDAQIFIMPHALQDLRISRSLMQRVHKAKPYLLTGDYSTDTLRALYGCMDVFVATRIHSAIFALSMATPVLAIAYEIPKGFGIVSMVEEKDLIMDIATLDSAKLYTTVKRLFEERQQRKSDIASKIQNLQNSIELRVAQFFHHADSKQNTMKAVG